MTMNPNELGQYAERQASQYLKARGYRIVAQNYRYLKAEVDIIAQKGQTLAIVEVKARTSVGFGNPESFVTKKKIALLVSAADHFITSQSLDLNVRFDIISLLYQNNTWDIYHLKNAFYAFDG